MWVQPIETALRPQALSAFDEGDVGRFLISASNTWSLDLVFWNGKALRERGTYERALLLAFTATRTNNHRCAITMLAALFSSADRGRLLAAGDPLPGRGPFTIYRGVGGRGAARRLRGFSWTASLARAKWFAERAALFGLAEPAVFQATVEASEVLAYWNDRNEEEFIVAPSGRITRVPQAVLDQVTAARAD